VDPLVLRLNRLYHLWTVLGLVLPTVMGGLLTGTWRGALVGLLWGGFARMVLSTCASGAVNAICHTHGHRVFATPDRSANSLWLALPTMGDSWHNNHHAFPNSARHGLTWWQLDPGYWLIRLLELVGLAWDVKRSSPRTAHAQ
jgi:stearoyl-CoA desaturase (delta-9 desaturase)